MSAETDRFADPAWEKQCRDSLLECIDKPELGSREWARRRYKLDLAKEGQKVRLADLDLRGRDLTGYGFPFTYLIRTQFNGAKLTDTRFDKTVIDDCNFEGADISGATFDKAHIIGRTFLTPSPLSKATTLTVRHLGGTVVVGPLLRKEIDSQRLLEELRKAPARWGMRLWNRLTNYGTSVSAILLLCFLVVAMWTAIYAFTYAYYPEALGLSKDTVLSFWDILIFSVERFINSSSVIEPVSTVIRWVQNLETLLGVLALAFSTALLVRYFISDGS